MGINFIPITLAPQLSLMSINVYDCRNQESYTEEGSLLNHKEARHSHHVPSVCVYEVFQILIFRSRKEVAACPPPPRRREQRSRPPSRRELPRSCLRTNMSVDALDGNVKDDDCNVDIYIMMKCLFVTKNEHFLLGVSCKHL